MVISNLAVVVSVLHTSDDNLGNLEMTARRDYFTTCRVFRKVRVDSSRLAGLIRERAHHHHHPPSPTAQQDSAVELPHRNVSDKLVQ